MEPRVSILEEKFEEFQKSQEEFWSNQTEFQSLQTNFKATQELILLQLQSLSARLTGGAMGESSEATRTDPQCQERLNLDPNHNEIGQNFNHLPRPPFLNMDFPRFNRTDDPMDWVYKADHYFDFFNIEESKKVKMASFHLEGDALQWFQWARCLENYPHWNDFIRVLCQEFGPSELDDSTESLVNLKQTSTLRDYVMEFRRLSNRTRDISHALLKSCFVGGLKPELRHDVKILRPRDVLEASAFAQQLDAKLTNLKVKLYPKTSSVQPTFRSPLQTINSTTNYENRAKPNNVRRLTPEEVDHCRRNRLCFHWREKYVMGHTCEKKQLLLIDVQEDENGVSATFENEELEITACALFGTPAPPFLKTMRVTGFVKQCPVTILVDSGSSHNFVDIGLVRRLKGRLDTWHTFNVKIADGGKVSTQGTLSQVPIRIQDYECITDLYAIPLGGCDVVLGVQWLRTLGPILWDFEKLYMQFTKGSSTYCIASPESPLEQLEEISALQMSKIVRQETTVGAILCQMELMNMFIHHMEPAKQEQHGDPLSVVQHHQLQQLLEEYEIIFSIPTTLHPHRFQDHLIPLLEGSKPPNSHPYRYGPIQK